MQLRPPGVADLVAGLSVAVVLIPQAMAYAELAGLPPQVGLFAAALPPLLAAPFVSSPYLQTGPVALTGLLTFGALEGRAETFTTEYVELAVLLALLVGVFRLVLGVLRLGNVAYLLSSPVLIGFTTGAAILIVASQLPQAVGVSPTGQGVILRAADTLASPNEWQPAALMFTAATAALMLGGRRLHQLFPGVLVAVLGGIIVSSVADYAGETIGELPGGFVRLHAVFPWGSALGLVPAAATIALIGFAEPSSIARSFATQDRQRWDANQEMIGQGVANVASAFSGGLPVGGSFSRSALSRMAGAKTAWTGATAGLIVLLVLPLAPLAEPLPRAVLASIVITSVVKLIDIRSVARLFKASVPQGVVALGTLVATLAFSPHVERGVFVGVALAIGVHLYRELNVVTEEHIDGSTLTISPQGVLWFATVPKIERICRSTIADDPNIDAIVLDLSGVGRLDYTGAATLRQSITTFTNAGITVELINIPPGARRAADVHFETPPD
jgi:SulP family sulfate permease